MEIAGNDQPIAGNDQPIAGKENVKVTYIQD